MCKESFEYLKNLKKLSNCDVGPSSSIVNMDSLIKLTYIMVL